MGVFRSCLNSSYYHSYIAAIGNILAVIGDSGARVRYYVFELHNLTSLL